MAICLAAVESLRRPAVVVAPAPLPGPGLLAATTVRVSLSASRWELNPQLQTTSATPAPDALPRSRSTSTTPAAHSAATAAVGRFRRTTPTADTTTCGWVRGPYRNTGPPGHAAARGEHRAPRHFSRAAADFAWFGDPALLPHHHGHRPNPRLPHASSGLSYSCSTPTASLRRDAGSPPGPPHHDLPNPTRTETTNTQVTPHFQRAAPLPSPSSRLRTTLTPRRQGRPAAAPHRSTAQYLT